MMLLFKQNYIKYFDFQILHCFCGLNDIFICWNGIEFQVLYSFKVQ